MHFRWNNGVLDVGWLWYRDGFGVELAWGRRDLMGEDVGEFESIFADHRCIMFASRRDVRIYGSVCRAIAARWFGL